MKFYQKRGFALVVLILAIIGSGVYASHGYERSHIDGVRNTYELVSAYVQR